MAKRIDKSRLTQDRNIAETRKKPIPKTYYMKGTKIKGEMEKDLARLKSIQESQKKADTAFKQKQKQSVQQSKESQRQFVKDYINSKNKSKMQMPKLGVAPKETTIKGGATKFLKRI